MAKQDVVVELYYDGAWQDITTAGEVYTRDPIDITRGQGDESTTLRPASAGLTAKNTSGKYNPRNPTSVLYGKAGRNTPARVRFPHPITDTFTRSVSSGWGTSTSGAVWTNEGGSATHFGVDGTKGWHDAQLSATTKRTLTDGPANGDATFTVSTPEVSSGEAAQASFIVREDGANTNFLCFRAVFLTTGFIDPRISIRQASVETTLANGPAVLPYVGGTAVHMRCIWHGPFLALKIWTDSDPEPAEWSCVAQDDTFLAAGRIGFRSAVGTDWASWAGTVPLRLTYDNLTLTRYRHHGEAASWIPGRAIKGDAWTGITTAGILRRLTQGTPPTRSALHWTILALATQPAAYWTMLSPEATTAGVAGMRVADITGSASPDLSWTTDSSVPVLGAAFTTAARDIYVRPKTGVAVGSTVVTDSALRARPTGNTSAFTLSHRAGNFFVNVIGNWATGVPTLTLTSNSGTLDTAADTDATRAWDEAPHAWRVTLTQNGADVDITVHMDGVEIMSGTAASVTLAGTDPDGFLPGLIAAGRAECVWASVVVWVGTAEAVADVHAALLGYPGEAAGTRFLRLCAEAGVPARVVGEPTATLPMGPQYPDTLPNLLQEIATTDDGYVYDSRHEIGLEFRTGRSRYNQTPILTIDHDAYELAPVTDPVIDDQATRNDVTAGRREGSEARAVRESGPLNVQLPSDDPEGVGRVPHRVDVNVFSDLVLPDVAGWHLHRGTIDEARWPAVVVDLDATPGLVDAAEAVDVGDRIVIENMPADLSPDDISLVVVGLGPEHIASHRRKLTYVCVPESQFHIAEVDRTGYNIVGSDSATTNEALDTTETGVDIVCGAGGPWVHEVDYDVVIGGERMTVTAVGASAGTFPNQTQTLTVTRSVNGVVKSHATGAPVGMFDKIYIGQ